MLQLATRLYAYIGNRRPVIVLIGGASGSGKSTLAVSLAASCYMQLVSSDNIRHIMRNFISKQESPFIFSSTYDSYHLIKDEGLTLEQRTIMAYLKQCKEVQRELMNVLRHWHAGGRWVVVEGVHITPEFIE